MEKIFAGAPIFKIIVHRDDFDKVGRFDERFHGIEDFHLFVKLLASGVELNVVHEPKGYYLIHSQSFVRSQQVDIHKQCISAGEWLLMSETMPKELDLTEKAVACCQEGVKYWSARYAETLWKLHRQQPQNYKFEDVLKVLIPTLPQLASLKTQNVLRKLKSAVNRN